MRKSLNNQTGVSIIATVLTLLMLAVFGAVIVSLVTTGSNIGLQEEQGVQALYVAEAGLQKALNYIIQQKDAACSVSETCACTDAAVYANTNPSLSAGSFNVTTTPTQVTNPTTLSGLINSIQTSIPVSSDPQGVYAAYGRIMIDREVIEYASLTANSFEGCRRGIAGTTASTHSLGTRVGQKQCTIASAGTISTNPLTTVQRQVSTVTELQNGWIARGGGAEDLNEVRCTAANNCWAVGTNGAIMQWNGSTWRKVPSPTAEDLNSVFMLSANNGWAVGNQDGNELILRWDGTTWNRLGPFANVADRNLNSVYMVSPNEVWIVGDDRPGGANNALAYRWRDTNGNGVVENAEWTYFDPGTDNDLQSVYMIDTNGDGFAEDGWTIGDNGVILRWNTPLANQWNNVASPAGSNLNSVYCTASNNCWAVGDTWNPPGPPPVQEVILRWTVGPNWALLPASLSIPNENLNGVYCVDDNNCWATGDNGIILRWNTPIPNTWNNVASPTTENLNSVYMVSAADGWAVGDNGTILKWDGISWTPFGGGRMLRWNGAAWTDKTSALPAGIDQTLRSVSMLSYADGWVVGNRRNNTTTGWTLLRWNPAGNTWTLYSSINPATGAQTLRSVHMISANDGWAVGNATGGELIIRWNGAAWNRVGPYAAIPDARLNSVHCVSANDCWAVGNASGGELIIRWNGAVWSRIGPYAGIPDAQLNSVFMIDTDGDGDADDGWIVGNNSGGELIIRWDGANWSRVGPYAGIPNVNLNSVYCTSANDCWAVGNTGTIIRWDGATWSAVASPTTENLNSIYMLTTNDGHAAGTAGTIIRWNGSSWSNATSPTTADLNGISLIGTLQPAGKWQEVFP